MTKAKFEWRVTKYKHTNLYTLVGWSGVKSLDNLPYEYSRYYGPRFFEDGKGHVALYGYSTGSLTKLRALKRGTVLEEIQYVNVEAHLRKSAEHLHDIEKTIKNSSKHITLEV